MNRFKVKSVHMYRKEVTAVVSKCYIKYTTIEINPTADLYVIVGKVQYTCMYSLLNWSFSTISLYIYTILNCEGNHAVIVS